MYAIASAPSAIRKTMMTRTRLPPERCTTSGLIPVMDFLLGIRSIERRGLCHAPRGSCQMDVAHPTAGAGASGAPTGRRRGADGEVPVPSSAGGEGRLGGVVDDEHLGQAGDAEDLEQAVLVAHQLQRAVVGPHLLQTADQDA